MARIGICHNNNNRIRQSDAVNVALTNDLVGSGRRGKTILSFGMSCMSDEMKRHEDALRSLVGSSRDRANQVEEFKSMFWDEEGLSSDFDPKIRILWDRLATTAKILRGCEGITFEGLQHETQLSPSELRQAIRVLITLGAELELTKMTNGDYCYILHN